MDRTRIIICILCLWGQFSHGQTNAFGKTIWDWDKSPSTRRGTFVGNTNGLEHVRVILDTLTWQGVYRQMRAWGPLGGAAAGGNVNTTTSTTNLVRIERVGQVLNVSLDGIRRYTATNNLVAQLASCVFNTHYFDSTSQIDNFQFNGVSDNFSNANSPNWKFYYEIHPVGVASLSVNGIGTPTQARWNAVASAIYGGITNGVMLLGPSGVTGDRLGNVIAQFTRPLSGDFVMQFEHSKKTQGGEFIVYFMTTSGSLNPRPGGNRSGLISSRPAFVTTLRRKFNPKTGKVEVIKNGVYTHRGYNNLLNGGRLNRRLLLRRYR